MGMASQLLNNVTHLQTERCKYGRPVATVGSLTTLNEQATSEIYG